MTTSETAECFACGRMLQEGDGRYHVRPSEQYCSVACIEKIAPDVAAALKQWYRAYAADAASVI